VDSSLFQSIWTVVAFVIFIGIVIWAWSGKRKKRFDNAARMALDDDKAVVEEERRDRNKT
jgi:cytochrome c oxidase cbb3-type subunit 4